MKRFLSILLALAMLIPLIACSGGNDDKPSKDTGSKVTTAEKDSAAIQYEEDDLPDLDFEGQTVTVLMGENSILEGDFSVEELTSNPINDSIYNREMFVEDRLGVEIEAFYPDDFATEVNKQINAQEDTYQIYGQITFRFAELVFDGTLIDLYSVEHLDLEKPWWSQTFADSAETCGELLMATGSITTSLVRSLFAVYYNKNIALDYVESTPELSDLYGLVNSGKWTFDKFIELGEGLYRDLNGNSEEDLEDFYGIGIKANLQIDPIFSSFDISALNRTDDGWFEFNENGEKLISAMEMMHDALYNTKGCFSDNYDSNETWIADDKYDEMFAGGTILFNVNRLYSAECEALRNMTDDYGVLPYPKYDEAQKEYYSHAHDQYISFGIPSTNQNPDVSGAVLEALASYSYRETEPIYLDMVLKGRYMSDPQSRKMIDIVVDGFKVDPAWIFITTISDSCTGDVRDMLAEGETNYASFYESEKRVVARKLKTFRSVYESSR